MRLARAILGLFGWRVVDNLPPTRKFVLVGAWHTSNWDFPIAMLATWGLGLPLSFIGKQELTKGRLGWLMKRLRVIGVDRSQRGQYVQKMAELFAERDELMLVVPAEGTRSQAEYWKTGFYYMALAAKVPIAFALVDASRKEVGIDGYFVPTGNRDDDLAVVKAFYQDKHGLKPHMQMEIRFRPVEESAVNTKSRVQESLSDGFESSNEG